MLKLIHKLLTKFPDDIILIIGAARTYVPLHNIITDRFYGEGSL